MVDNIKNLPPEERIKKLKKLQKEKEQELAAAAKIIKESEGEITARNKWTEKVPIPEVAQDTLVGLSEDGAQLLKLHHGTLAQPDEESTEEKPPAKSEPSLEETLAGTSTSRATDVQYALPQELSPQILNQEYAAHLSYTPVNEIQDRVKNVYDAVQQRGYMRWEEHDFVQTARSALEMKANAAESGKYTMADEVASRALATQATADKLLHNQYKTAKSSDKTHHNWYQSSG
jgi:hypothetical protein